MWRNVKRILDKIINNKSKIEKLNLEDVNKEIK